MLEKFIIQIVTVLTDVSHAFSLSSCEYSEYYRVLDLSELSFVAAAILLCM